MRVQTGYEKHDERPTEDHVVRLSGVCWEDYERLLAMRGDRSAPRIAYLGGEVEIMSPSQTHEGIKSIIGCLVEVYCLERDIPFSTYGSWTLQSQDWTRGAEPDECYIFGEPSSSASGTERPHLTIEVVWTAGRIDKLDIYPLFDNCPPRKSAREAPILCN
jgi:Uma2 family endonuclease